MFSVDLFTAGFPLFQVTELQEFEVQLSSLSAVLPINPSRKHKARRGRDQRSIIAYSRTRCLPQRAEGGAVAAAVMEITLGGRKQNYF